MADLDVSARMDEAEKILAELQSLLERDPNFEKEKPGSMMQQFYLAIRDVQQNLSRLTLEERERFDALNDAYKNLVGDIARRLVS